MSTKQFHYAWEWRLPVTPDALWPYVSDTNRFNRDTGLPPVQESAGERPGVRRLRLRRFGVLIEWEEEPFEWVRPHSFGVSRRYFSGPVAELRVRASLRPDGAEGCILSYSVIATPRTWLGRLAIPVEVGILSARRFERVCRKYAEEARAEAARALPLYTQYHIAFLAGDARLTAGADARIARIRDVLVPQFDAAIVERLIEVVRRADDLSAVRLRPYVLADLWNVPRRRTLDLCLHATRAGLLDLQWDVLCPGCRGAKQTHHTLAGLSQPVHCDGCNIDFHATFEQAVELTFRPNPAIRHVEVYPFCVGGPQLTPHIVVQQVVGAGEARTLQPLLESGRYRVRAGNVPGAQLFRVEPDGERELSLIATSEGFPNREPCAALAPSCTLVNRTSEPQLMLIERIAWSDQALTAAEVIALQEFRDLFSAEVLRPGEAISVGTLAIMFTDLRGSTRMYREIGDAPAFGRVISHFDVLRAAIEAEEGALIKTIGDAVMAVFRRPAGAIRTILRAHELLSADPGGVQPEELKAGVHFGPCIAVTLNERLDYFGSTVNVAARLEALSRGGDVVISEIVAADPEVQSLLQHAALSAAPFQAQIKGYEEAARTVLSVGKTVDSV